MIIDDVVRARQRWRYLVYSVLCTGLAIHVIYYIAFGDGKDGLQDAYRSRKLLEAPHDYEHQDIYHFYEVQYQDIEYDFVPNLEVKNVSLCRTPSVDTFPDDLFTETQRRHGAIIIHLAVLTYLCVAIGIAADYYFIPSLELICYLMNIQEDVGGATLMCIGSSAPDVCAAIVGILLTDGDVGIGTILGASVFNILFVVGFCGILAYEALVLSWWPFARDVVWYCISISILVIVILDSSVHWQEAVIMLIFYFIYCISLWQNKRIEKRIYLIVGDTKSYQTRFESEVIDYTLMKKDEVKVDEDDVSKGSDEFDYCGYPLETPENIFECPGGNALRVFSWIVVLPIKIAFFLTIPDLRRPKCQKFVSVTFVMGIIWIGFLTYFLLWMVTIIGHTLDIPDSVMGITFVALGTSVPDCICSILVAKRGKPDMAVSQSIASNTFGILFGLGLPWLIKTLSTTEYQVKIQSIGMLISSLMNIFIALLTLAVFIWRKFILGRKLGIVMVCGYIVYLIFNVVLEVRIYINQRLPLCKIVTRHISHHNT